MTSTNLTGKLHRWALTLQEYEFEVEYRPGSTNVVADALSRSPVKVLAAAGKRRRGRRRVVKEGRSEGHESRCEDGDWRDEAVVTSRCTDDKLPRNNEAFEGMHEELAMTESTTMEPLSLYNDGDTTTATFGVQRHDGNEGTTEEGAGDVEVTTTPVNTTKEVRTSIDGGGELMKEVSAVRAREDNPINEEHKESELAQSTTSKKTTRPRTMTDARATTQRKVVEQPVSIVSSRPMTRAARRRQEDAERKARDEMMTEDENVNTMSTVDKTLNTDNIAED
ncbi:hypothetical protein F443_14830 [Phytophthora nicotianae P1569]|uniref:Reverse transcriptase RNase H-like domain-containing protein n=1 Tax=Phytophthora nicotianae P1569 TaxID=1317065 RepID=V9END5_PHYNI|nr:hypothetical protein F443_14830 [Phytophthora nicotianae P1569]